MSGTITMSMNLNDGNGYVDVSTRKPNSLAVLDSLSIEWGTANPYEQPEPAVCRFTLIDHAAQISVDPTQLTGAKVKISLDNANIFAGTITSGATITTETDHVRIDTSATSDYAIWKRLRSQGTEFPYWPGIRGKYYWYNAQQSTGLINEFNKRAQAAGAPQVYTPTLPGKRCYAPVPAGDYPSQFDMLHWLYAAYRLPLWAEWDAATIGHAYLIARRCKALLSDWTFANYAQNNHRSTSPDIPNTRPLPADKVQTDGRYTLGDPYTQYVFRGKRMIWETHTDVTGNLIVDEGLDVTDRDVTCTDETKLPAALKTSQKSVIVDALTVMDCSTDLNPAPYSYTATPPTSVEKDDLSNLLKLLDTHLRPENLTVDSLTLDAATYKHYFMPTMLDGITITGTIKNPLARKVLAGTWMMIGGLLTYGHHSGKPVLTHRMHVIPVANMHADDPTWTNTANWNGIYNTAGDMSLNTLCNVQQFNDRAINW